MTFARRPVQVAHPPLPVAHRLLPVAHRTWRCISITTAALLLMMLLPSAAIAELRRVDLQVLGMD